MGYMVKDQRVETIRAYDHDVSHYVSDDVSHYVSDDVTSRYQYHSALPAF